MKSENPVKYGELYILNRREKKIKILSVNHDIVVRSDFDNFDISSLHYHYTEFLKDFTLLPQRKWEPLTEKNWEQYRDKIVWNENGMAVKLLARTNGKNPYIVEYENETLGRICTVSAYNNDSERPIWGDE